MMDDGDRPQSSGKATGSMLSAEHRAERASMIFSLWFAKGWGSMRGKYVLQVGLDSPVTSSLLLWCAGRGLQIRKGETKIASSSSLGTIKTRQTKLQGSVSTPSAARCRKELGFCLDCKTVCSQLALFPLQHLQDWVSTNRNQHHLNNNDK